MKKEIKFCLLIGIMVVATLTKLGQSLPTENCEKEPKFRYVIVNNFLSQEKKASERSREILIFFDEASFSEENLKNLFERLSKKYPSPHKLYISVETNWSNIPTPEECAIGVSEQTENQNEQEKLRLRALFFRVNENEVFRFNSSQQKLTFKTIVLKGSS